MSNVEEFVEYYDNGNIRTKILCYHIESNNIKTSKFMETHYNESMQIIKCEITESKSDTHDINSLLLTYYDSGNVKQIEWRKNGLLHKDNSHSPSRIAYYDNQQMKSIAWYHEGLMLCHNEGDNYMYEKWWEYEPYIKSPSSIDYYENGNVLMELYQNKLLINIIEYYNTGGIKYNIKFNKQTDGFVYNEFYTTGDKINTKTWMFKGDYHNISDYPAYIMYHDNGKEKVKEWWIFGTRFRLNDKPIYEEYSNNGNIIKKVWNKNEMNNIMETYYENTGNIRSRIWQKNYVNHRDNDKPAVIYYYDVNVNDIDIINNIKYEEWWKNGKLKRDNLLHTKIKYNTNGKLVRAYWLYENRHSQIVNVVVANQIMDILYIYELVYEHETVGSPKYGFMNFIKNKIHKFFYNNYKKEIEEYSTVFQKKFAIQNNCFNEILYLPPMLNNKFNGGKVFLEVLEDSCGSGISLNPL